MLRRQLISILLLVAFLLGLGQDLIQRTDAVHGHVVCPEHGELLHVGVSPAEGAARWTSPEAHGLACDLALPSGLLGVVLAAGTALALDLPALAALDAQDPPLAVVWVSSPLLVAPKTSPPVA